MSKTVSFSYTTTKLFLVGSVMTAALMMVVVVVFGLNPNKPTETDFGATQYPVTLGSLANGCGDVFKFTLDDKQYGEIPESVSSAEGLVSIPIHRSIIPVYGYMDKEPLSASQVRFYSMDELDKPLARSKVLRTMYDRDTIVVWYSPDIALADYELIKQYVSEHDNILAVKWENEQGSPLPLDRKIGFSAWGISQSCEFWTDQTFETFAEFVEENRVERPEVAPMAEPNQYGLLPVIDRPSK